MMLKPDATRAEIVAKLNELVALAKVLTNAHPMGITKEGDVVITDHLFYPRRADA